MVYPRSNPRPLDPSRNLAASAGQTLPLVTSRGAPGVDRGDPRGAEEKARKTGRFRAKTRDFTKKYGEVDVYY